MKNFATENEKNSWLNVSLVSWLAVVYGQNDFVFYFSSLLVFIKHQTHKHTIL